MQTSVSFTFGVSISLVRISRTKFEFDADVMKIPK